MTLFYLSKQGYGSLKEIKELDTDDILNLISYENLLSDIEFLQYEDAQKENSQ